MALLRLGWCQRPGVLPYRSAKLRTFDDSSDFQEVNENRWIFRRHRMRPCHSRICRDSEQKRSDGLRPRSSLIGHRGLDHARFRVFVGLPFALMDLDGPAECGTVVAARSRLQRQRDEHATSRPSTVVSCHRIGTHQAPLPHAAALATFSAIVPKQESCNGLLPPTVRPGRLPAGGT